MVLLRFPSHSQGFRRGTTWSSTRGVQRPRLLLLAKLGLKRIVLRTREVSFPALRVASYGERYLNPFHVDVSMVNPAQ